MRFKFYIESSSDKFGFDRPKEEDPSQTELDNKPMSPFDTELMMRLLSRYRLGVMEANVPFMNEIQWGGKQFGAVKLEVNSRMQFFFQKLGRDLEGHPRWVTKKTFQLNRRGYGGYEESVAQEAYGYLQEIAQGGLEGPIHDFDELAEVAKYVSAKLQKSASALFIYEGIKRVSDDNYQIVFGVRGQGVQAPGQLRVEQNVTDISFDENCGTIRIRNYNVSSPVGGPHSWKVMPAHMDLYFFPTQDRQELAEPVSVLLKYY